MNKNKIEFKNGSSIEIITSEKCKRGIIRGRMLSDKEIRYIYTGIINCKNRNENRWSY